MTLYRASVFLVWLMVGSAIIGTILGYRDWFADMTHLNLALTTLLLFLNYPINNVRKGVVALLIMVIGFGVEVLGVATSFPFGTYSYGENLGPKVLDVPLLIGANWLYLSLGMGTLAAMVTRNRIYRSAVGALLMVAIDVLIEPGAKMLDYWSFEEVPVPMENYIGWFVVAFLIQLLIHSAQIKERSYFTVHLILTTLLYFATLLLTS